MREEKAQNTKVSKQQSIIIAFNVALVILILDAIGNSLLSAYSLALPREYLQETESFYFLRFFQNLGFGTLIYINKVILIYIVLTFLFIFITKFIKNKQHYYIIFGIILAFIFYFFYAYNWSMNHFRNHFSYHVFWYSFLGGFYGWIYFKKHSKITPYT